MIYDAKNGYGLKFTKCDEQYEDCIIYRNSKEAIIRLADTIICSFDKIGLLWQLNEMQSNAQTIIKGELVEAEAFKNKFEIPSYFINLILKEYNMQVLGW